MANWLDWVKRILNAILALFGDDNSAAVQEGQQQSITDSTNEENDVVEEHNNIDASNSGVTETDDGGLNFDAVNKKR